VSKPAPQLPTPYSAMSLPSGKLTMSFPRAVGQEPLYYNQLPTGRPIQHADPAHPGYVEMKFVSRYLDVPNDALFPSGMAFHILRSAILVFRFRRNP